MVLFLMLVVGRARNSHLTSDLDAPFRKRRLHEFCGVLLVASAEFLAYAENRYRPIRFEANMGTSELVNLYVLQPEILDFCFGVAQNIPVPQITGSEQDGVFNSISADRYQKNFTFISFRQYNRADSADGSSVFSNGTVQGIAGRFAIKNARDIFGKEFETQVVIE
jgi:hypothetical protein